MAYSVSYCRHYTRDSVFVKYAHWLLYRRQYGMFGVVYRFGFRREEYIAEKDFSRPSFEERDQKNRIGHQAYVCLLKQL